MKFRKLKNRELPRLTINQFKDSEKTPLVIILDNIRSLHNVGSVFRTADAFLIEKIYLCGITACPPHKDITKTALGATENVSWEFYEDPKEVVLQLKNKGYQVFAIEQTENSSSLLHKKIAPKTPIAVVFGNEVKGVQQEVIALCDDVLEIPQYGTKHSLNISVSVGIVIWDLFKQLKSV